MRNTIITFFVVPLFLIVACQSSGDNKSSKETDAKPDPKKEAVSKVDGEKIFKMNCVVCHGMDGKLGLNGAKDLGLSELTLEERVLMVTKGKNLMTPFESILKEDQINAVAEYTFKL